MSRKPNIIPSVVLNLALPMDVHSRLSLHLFSELENRIPLGSFQRFFAQRIRDYFDNKELDLAPYLQNVPSGTFVVSGSAEAVLALKQHLMKANHE